MSLYRGGYRIVGPARDGLLDHHPGADEACDDHTEPEESDQTSVGGDVDQTVDGGELQELLDTLTDTLHPEAELVLHWGLGGPSWTANNRNLWDCQSVYFQVNGLETFNGVIKIKDLYFLLTNDCKLKTQGISIESQK